jgi:hypothetical protein
MLVVNILQIAEILIYNRQALTLYCDYEGLFDQLGLLNKSVYEEELAKDTLRMVEELGGGQ